MRDEVRNEVEARKIEVLKVKAEAYKLQHMQKYRYRPDNLHYQASHTDLMLARKSSPIECIDDETHQLSYFRLECERLPLNIYFGHLRRMEASTLLAQAWRSK